MPQPGPRSAGMEKLRSALALAALASPPCIFLAAALLRSPALRGILDDPVLGTKDVPNIARNALELGSFGATCVLGLTAIGALLFTIRQLGEAKNTRLATIYMEIINRWNSPEIVESRKLSLDLNRDYREDGRIAATVPTVADFIDLFVSCVRDNDLKLHRRYVATLNFYEDVGGLCWKGYVREEDIFDFMAGQIVTQVELFSAYIDSARNKRGTTNRSTYANTIYLYNKAKAYRAYLHEEDWPPAP